MVTYLNNQEIYERIYAAITERRLPPGTKLSEERLAQAFHASRTRIHEILMRLSHELVIEIHQNRGAFVASPTPRDLNDIFAVRRALERAVVISLSEKGNGQVAALRNHLEAEANARIAGDKVALTKLTGEFHVKMAEITGNRLLSDNLRRLIALTGLAIAQYKSLASSACPEHEHDNIVHAIEAGDTTRAERILQEHLDHVERGIQIPVSESGEIDFEQVFQLN